MKEFLVFLKNNSDFSNKILIQRFQQSDKKDKPGPYAQKLKSLTTIIFHA